MEGTLQFPLSKSHRALHPRKRGGKIEKKKERKQILRTSVCRAFKIPSGAAGISPSSCSVASTLSFSLQVSGAGLIFLIPLLLIQLGVSARCYVLSEDCRRRAYRVSRVQYTLEICFVPLFARRGVPSCTFFCVTIRSLQNTNSGYCDQEPRRWRGRAAVPDRGPLPQLQPQGRDSFWSSCPHEFSW